MRKSRILTIDDLVKFCQDQNFTQFSSKDSGYSIHVQIPCENFEFVEDEDPLTFYGNVKLMHTGRNRNKSTLTEKGAKSCLSKIAYKPVLADFTEVNGERDFTYHAIEYNDDGSRTYIEKQVGCFTSDKPYMKQDPDHEDRKYIYAKVAIPREYTDAAEIIERKGGTKVSAELCINEMSYSIEDGLLLEDVDVMGVTLLGTDPGTGEPVEEGMQGAYLQIEDFSAENNSIISKTQLKEEIITEIMSQLNNDKKAFAENLKEGGKSEDMDKFNELLAKYNKTVEDVTFEYENMTDEELEAAFANAFEVADDSGDSSSEEVDFNDSPEDEKTKVEMETTKEEVTDEVSEAVEEFEDDDPAEDDSNEEDHQDVSAIEDEDSTGVTTKIVNIAVGEKTFELSLDDVNYSINCLVNDMYSETDNTYYMTVVYPESKHVIMIDAWNSSKAFKQSYKDRKGVYSLVGERIPVRSMWVTSDEEAELDNMRSNYSSIESELNTFKEKELHSQREAVLASEDYSVMAEFDEFKELKSHMDEYTVDELTNKADLIYAKFMKSNYSTFAVEHPKTMVFMSTGDTTPEEKLPYGGLFKNFKNRK